MASLERVVQELCTELADCKDKFNSLFGTHQQEHQFESLGADSQVSDAAQIPFKTARIAGDEVEANMIISE